MERVSKMTSYPGKKAVAAAAYITGLLAKVPPVALVTGSGLGGIGADMTDTRHISYADIPHFPVSAIKGHAGEIVAGRMGTKDLMVFSGRVHYYEGYAIQTVVFPMQVLAALGTKAVVLTNACGSVNPDFSPGDAVLIQGHLDLMREISLSMREPQRIYDPGLNRQAKKAAGTVGVRLKEGIYAAFSGPSYETPAEIRAAAVMGADMVGMSTVPEATEAHELGLRVMGISFITNLAAGLSQNPLSHKEVIEIADKNLPMFTKLLKQIVQTQDLTES